MPETQTSYDADVIVVGAGPTGLTTGCALRHHGVDCLMLETRTETKPFSRANNIWARPQELLAAVGLREAMAEQAYQIRTANFFIDGVPSAPIRLDAVDSPYPQVLFSGQDIIESKLIEVFEARGGRIERGCEAVGLEQDEAGVTVAFKRGDDAPEERLRARYLVGADGAKSTIRPLVGLDFEPERFEGRINRLMDAKMTWRRSMDFDQLWYWYYEKGLAGFQPVWGGHRRLFFLSDDAGVPDRDPTLEEIQALAREVTGDDTLTLSDPVWVSHSRFQFGVSPAYAAGRVLLAGDAGHLALPIGGQGMNSGQHDAVEVAWRLAMTLRGEAAPVVLESYSSERGGEHARLNAQQVRGFKASVYRGPIADAALGLANKVLPNIGSLILGTDDLHQLSVSYPKSPLNEDHLTGLTDRLTRRGVRAGERAPDAEVIHQGETTSLFPFLYNPDGRTTGWALLCFDGRSPEARADLLAAVAGAAPWGQVRPRLVLAGPLLSGGDAPVLSDMDGKAHAAYGLEGQPALVLVRPDGHIAYLGAVDRPDRLAAYCRKVFGEAAAAAS